METEDEAIFRALADPTRRRLLDRLFERDGRTLSELESELPMTRFGVMKHLRVLEEAGLIATRKVGRERFHYLNPVPIQLIADRWINKYAAARVSALADLKIALEGAPGAAAPRLVAQIMIKAPPERVWAALAGPGAGAPSAGGGLAFADHRPDGAAAFAGAVVASDPPNRLVHTWYALGPPLNDDAPATVAWELEALPGGVTKLTVTHDGFQGETATYRDWRGGGWAWVLSAIKTLLETGEPLRQRTED